MRTTLQKCCFCIDLKIGSFGIGYLYLIGHIMLVLLELVAFGNVPAPESPLGEFGIIIMWIIMFVFILNLIFTIVLLIGLHQSKPGHVMAFLIYSIMFIVICFFTLLISDFIFTNVINVIVILLFFYSLLVLTSYYLEMDDSTTTPILKSLA